MRYIRRGTNSLLVVESSRSVRTKVSEKDGGSQRQYLTEHRRGKKGDGREFKNTTSELEIMESYSGINLYQKSLH